MTRKRPAGPPRFLDAETWVFDLDNTLYSPRYDLFELVDERIAGFIVAALGLDAVEARRIQKDYFRRYGTTLRGLMLDHAVDPKAFLDFVHAVDVTRVPPNPGLDRALARLGGRKVIFTNATARHAENVIERLGVAGRFEAIFDIVDADYVPKPHPDTYSTLVERHRIDPRRAIIVDDIARNLAPAAEMGMTTVWVRNDTPWGREGSDGAHVDHAIDDLAEWLTEIVDGAPAG